MTDQNHTEQHDESRQALSSAAGSVSSYLREFQEANEKIEPFDLCLCIDGNGSHRILPILRNGKFLNGELEMKAVWFCKVETATRLIGQLFSHNAKDYHGARNERS